MYNFQILTLKIQGIGSVTNVLINLFILIKFISFNSKVSTWRQKIGILIRIQFLNDIIKLRHGFTAAQKFLKFRVFIKTIKLFEIFEQL